MPVELGSVTGSVIEVQLGPAGDPGAAPRRTGARGRLVRDPGRPVPRREPQGFNPRDLLLEKIVQPPEGPAATIDLRYEEQANPGDFDTVTILPTVQPFQYRRCSDMSAPVNEQLTEPNDYELSCDGVTLTYSTTSFDGSPRLSFREGGRALDFSGEEIGTLATKLGTEVTVTLEVISDDRTVTLTLLVPAINLGEGPDIEFATVAIETTNLTTIGGPALITGPLQTYRVIELNGTAKRVDF